MAAYLTRVKGYLEKLEGYNIEQIPRERNTHIDTLEFVPVEYLSKPSITEVEVHLINTPKESWVSPIMIYLKDRALPIDKRETRRLAYKVAQYTLVEGVLYKRGFFVLLLRCVDEEEAMKVLYEIHDGECGNHASRPSMARKAMRQGYYWPSMEKDASDFARKYGVSYKIISDNGTQFEGEMFEEYCKEKGIRISFSDVVHPQANGQAQISTENTLSNCSEKALKEY
ncbi:uncharacterized protein LOC133825709 [Humulus lupulus]|uniref:uncharacterized protein LOC133825709 n=1 Tax=Humulus lupulus TaxID=3486 RepID=UPI002B411262|nr:uncharacterized protein LOC133825709 [Humulus lupulus]